MDAKLTLKLDSSIIDQAKLYAKQKNTSLSKLIETYLSFVTESKEDTNEVTPLVKSLSGVINLPKDFDYKKSYKEYVVGKYTK